MGHQFTLDVSGWGALLGLIIAAITVASTVAGILRLWLQPQVGRWIDKAIEREGKTFLAQVVALERKLDDCQTGRPNRIAGIEAEMRRIEVSAAQEIRRVENGLANDIREIKTSLQDLHRLAESLAGVKAEVSSLHEMIRGLNPVNLASTLFSAGGK